MGANSIVYLSARRWTAENTAITMTCGPVTGETIKRNNNYCDYDNQLNLKMDITIVIVTQFILNSNPIDVCCSKTNPTLLSVTSNETTSATRKPQLNIFNKQSSNGSKLFIYILC